MREIKILAEYIHEEIEDAEKYAEAALKEKDRDSRAMSLFVELSREELKHAEKLHDRAKALIKNFEEQGGAAPESMKAVWEWEHEKIIRKTLEVKMLLDNLAV